MNSRQRRKQAAQEHNDRIGLVKEVGDLQLAIYVKHGARVRFIHGDTNDILREQIAKLRGMLESDTPPPRQAPGRSSVNAKIALAFMGGMGMM